MGVVYTIIGCVFIAIALAAIGQAFLEIFGVFKDFMDKDKDK